MYNTVFVAVRHVSRSTVVGYFASAEEVPTGWTISVHPRNIADVMTANHCSKEQALRLMNAHWQH